MTLPPDAWLTTDEAAARLRITRRTLERWVEAGTVREYRTPTGGKRYRPEDVDAALTQNSPDPEEKP
jgi:excisionase family DNA binding protein